MKNGKLALSGFLGITLAAFALPCWGMADVSTAPASSRTVSGTQYAGGAGEHSEHEEHEYTAPAPSHEEHEEHERMEHENGGKEEHGGTRNFMEQHVPGTEAHQEHEEHEGEEHHNYHHHDKD